VIAAPAAAAEPAMVVPLGLRPISDGEFRLFQDLVYRECGIFLGPHKKQLLMSRLASRLRELGIDTFGDYFRRASGTDGEERRRMIESLCTHETSFFREPRQFEFLEKQVIPAWTAAAAARRRARRVRVWSAGCSTGEEPFSIAMLLASHLPCTAGWSCEVLATDLSLRALGKAAEATWPVRRAAEIPAPLLKRFMLKGVRSQEGTMRATADLRSLVRFQALNLNDPVYPFEDRFDLIFCRNVLIYFDAASRDRVTERLLRHLEPGGHLFLGHSESLLGRNDRVRSALPSVYTLAER
jgi:chemotaxis protein methyltransferase CheR